jgi:hypothetical protein
MIFMSLVSNERVGKNSSIRNCNETCGKPEMPEASRL